MTNNQPAFQQADQSEPPMSFDEARQIKWKYPPYPTLGEMWDRGELTADNLKYALKTGHRQLRRAARTLLDELEQHHTTPFGAPSVVVSAPVTPLVASTQSASPAQPSALYSAPSVAAPVAATAASPRYGPRVVIASEYLEEQESFHGWLLAYYIGLGVGSVALTINTILFLLRGQALWLTASSIAANIAAWIWLIVVIQRQILHVRTFRQGRKGEERIVEQLRSVLDHRWTIYRNLQLPDRKSDLDLVLVGPGGVWAVQVKATGAPLRV